MCLSISRLLALISPLCFLTVGEAGRGLEKRTVGVQGNSWDTYTDRWKFSSDIFKLLKFPQELPGFGLPKCQNGPC